MEKNSKLLIILGVLVVIVIGVTFAYFITGVTFIGTGANDKGTAAELSQVTYDAGTSVLSASNLVPNGSASKEFKVSITPGSDSNTVTYAIKLKISENTFEYCDDDNYILDSNECTKNAEELIYTLKDDSGNVIATDDLTAKTGDLFLATETKTVTATTDYNYTLEITFKNTNADQNHNTNKSLIAELKVEFAE